MSFFQHRSVHSIYRSFDLIPRMHAPDGSFRESLRSEPTPRVKLPDKRNGCTLWTVASRGPAPEPVAKPKKGPLHNGCGDRRQSESNTEVYGKTEQMTRGAADSGTEPVRHK
jgi:hypothetical protein